MASPRLEIRDTQKEQWGLLAGTGELYAIVETRGPAGVREKAREVGPRRALSLYQGTYEAQYENSAPVFFLADHAIFDWIVNSFWGTSWGILIRSDAGFGPLRAHLQKFLRVRGADQKQYLFRFYDPYILGPFLKSCNDAELAEFFGPVKGFGANEGQQLTLFRMAPLPK